MRILVDADGCPVRHIIVRIARSRGVPVVMVADTNHRIEDGYSEVIITGQGRDAADLALINHLEPGDIVVTQDYGVATMALAKRVRAVSQNGFEYTETNIDQLLFRRFLSRKVRKSGGKSPKIKKRSTDDDERFEELLIRLLEEKDEPD